MRLSKLKAVLVGQRGPVVFLSEGTSYLEVDQDSLVFELSEQDLQRRPQRRSLANAGQIAQFHEDDPESGVPEFSHCSSVLQVGLEGSTAPSGVDDAVVQCGDPHERRFWSPAAVADGIRQSDGESFLHKAIAGMESLRASVATVASRPTALEGSPAQMPEPCGEKAFISDDCLDGLLHSGPATYPSRSTPSVYARV